MHDVTMKSAVPKLGLALYAGLVLTACGGEPRSAPEQVFTPGLGEIMAQTAMRHTKLWFAGQAQNWQLAAYELDELREGFADAATFHPTHKTVPQPIPQLLAKYTDPPLAALDLAVNSRDAAAFAKSFQELTDGCNACHAATEFGFNRVITPAFNPFANQAF